MKGLPEERAVQLAHYIIESNATFRQTAKKFNISKSTVHKDITNMRASKIDHLIWLYAYVKAVLAQTYAELHLR